MALRLLALGLVVAVASGVVAAALGFGVVGIFLAYAGCGSAVLFGALFGAMILDGDELPREDPMLIPGE